MNGKHQQNIYHASVNASDGKKGNSNQKQSNNKCSIKILRNIIHTKKIIFGILLHAVAKIANI